MADDKGLSAAERDAVRQRAAELRAGSGVKGAAKARREAQACRDAIAALTGTDRVVAELLDLVVTQEAPELAPKTWYGFPSYAREGKVVVFFQPAAKFSTRYGTVGFTEQARLDVGPMWPTSFAVVEVDDEVETRLRTLVRQAAGNGQR
ncbi:hypothetical protein [uncultured Bifidobacterium sp.]|uniref:hypothetical protein n=1 Tax=uncultured Bifidobacterium sp. TaxID=165187 RepID=UPI0028DCEFBA|nr:hypothetical protein [uncultured Bifidobacterium sp.]